MLLSIIIPLYNEKNNIKIIVNKIQKVGILSEIIIVDDGSTDGSREILPEIAAQYSNVRYYLHERNQGKGAAIKTAIDKCTGEITIIQDADLEYDPMDYLLMLPYIRDKKLPVIYGSRFLNKQNKHSYETFFWGGQFVTWIGNVLFNQNLTDEPTCYKMFETSLLKSIKLECTRFEFCPEVTAKIAKMGIKIQEVPISYYPRTISEGKKINWKDGVEAIWTFVKFRFVN